MSLYLAVFDENDEELNGFQVGTYHDYGKFIDTIIEKVEEGKKESKCPILVGHHDSDGFWSTQECESLLLELTFAKKVLEKYPPEKINYDWMQRIKIEVPSSNLYESLLNVDGEPIIEKLFSLCQLAIANNAKIYFQ